MKQNQIVIVGGLYTGKTSILGKLRHGNFV
jgi:hypothetical protein